MGVFDRVRTRARQWLGVEAGVRATAPGLPPSLPPSHAQGHVTGRRYRVSEDNPTINYLQGLTILAPLDSEHRWRNLNLDENTLDQLGTADIVDLLADLSPEISSALNSYVRLVNPGYEIKCFKLNLNSEEIEPKAQQLVETFFDNLRQLYGSTDLVIDRMFINAFLRGAFMAELVLDNRGRVPIDIAFPDPRWTYFRIALDAQRGPIWQPYQFQHGRPVPLVLDTIRYIPIDPLPASPYGRSMVLPAVFTTLFTLSMLHDLKRVVAQQGYPRLDLSVNLEALAKSMPADLAKDPLQYQQWIDSVVRNIGDAYANLEPDDTYVHTDNVTVGRPVGTLDTSSLGAVDGMMRALDRQVIRALKTMPLLMGSNEGASETHANRQWEVFAAGIKSHQHTAESLWEHLLTLALRVQGVQARVQFRFAELRAAELLRDAQVEALNLQNAALSYALGYRDQNEAAMVGAGKEKADQPQPRIPTAGITGAGGGAPPGQTAPGAVQPEPGSNKKQKRSLNELLPAYSARAVLPEDLLSRSAVRSAQEAWDRAVPDLAGLLDAQLAEERRAAMTNGRHQGR